MSEKKITCVTCPLGCKLKINIENNKIISVRGNQCKKGIKFAEVEIRDPRRILTTTMKLKAQGGQEAAFNRLPVRSGAPAPKDKILEIIKEIRKIKVSPPVKMGDIIAKNIIGSGVDIIASMNVEN